MDNTNNKKKKNTNTNTNTNQPSTTKKIKSKVNEISFNIKNKLNAQNVNSSGFIYTSLAVMIIILILTYIYYEFYYLKTTKDKKTKVNNNVVVLLDKNNNKGNPYHINQNFGTDKDGNVAYNNNIEVNNLDRFITYPNDYQNCSNSISAVSIFMNIKFPYVYSNKDWNSSYQNYKPIIQFGSSPKISYNPYNHRLILSLVYKDNPNLVKVRNINVKEIPIEKWVKLVFVIDNRKIKIYLNNQIINYEILPGVPILDFRNNYLVKIGDYNNNFNGHINNITMYLKSLTTKEIKNL